MLTPKKIPSENMIEFILSLEARVMLYKVSAYAQSLSI